MLFACGTPAQLPTQLAFPDTRCHRWNSIPGIAWNPT